MGRHRGRTDSRPRAKFCEERAAARLAQTDLHRVLPDGPSSDRREPARSSRLPVLLERVASFFQSAYGAARERSPWRGQSGASGAPGARRFFVEWQPLMRHPPPRLRSWHPSCLCLSLMVTDALPNPLAADLPSIPLDDATATQGPGSGGVCGSLSGTTAPGSGAVAKPEDAGGVADGPAGRRNGCDARSRAGARLRPIRRGGRLRSNRDRWPRRSPSLEASLVHAGRRAGSIRPGTERAA